MNYLYNNKNEIYINLALYINKLMCDDKIITYDLYRISQELLLKGNVVIK
ncbi:MAG: hypothetical protein IKF19_04535 [Bacilli bacterium]|nr:hypothetical protein [Bacilli bacterium]